MLQVLSHTVGSVMKTFGPDDDRKETAKFILLMDKFFDCLNTRWEISGHLVSNVMYWTVKVLIILNSSTYFSLAMSASNERK